MSDQDFAYFTRREQAERACAERSQDQTARRVHLALAERYAERLKKMVPPQPMPSPA